MFANWKVNLKFIKGILFTPQISQLPGQIIIMVFLNCWHQLPLIHEIRNFAGTAFENGTQSLGTSPVINSCGQYLPALACVMKMVRFFGLVTGISLLIPTF